MICQKDARTWSYRSKEALNRASSPWLPNDDNPGSYKTIEANGGIFDRFTEFEGKKARRYWIELLK
jgi:hypothetical protein